LFAYRYEAKYDPRLAGSSSNGITPFTFTRVDSQETTTSLAPFGEGTLDFFTHWALTAGFRYTYEHKAASGTTNSGPEISASHTWGNFSPRVILEYKIPQAANLYASYSEGFKSGLYKIDSLSSPLNRVDPETLDAYEVGIESAASERWRVNLAAFYYNHNNIQISAFSFPSIFLLNAAKGKAEGFESQFDASVTTDLRANAFVSYTHTDYTSFPNAIIDVPTGIGGNEQINGVNESGQPFLRAPQWLAGAGLAYKHSFASGVVGADADYSYNGGFNWEITGRVREPHYGLLNANLSWSPPKEDYTVTVWGTNLTNQPYEISGNASTIGDNIVFGRPRSIGVKVGFKFD
jgi:iron complex outermembrane recepter protein